MTTVKQLERTWTAKQYERLYKDLVECRAEAGLAFEFEADWSLPAAAMAVVRMDELSQAHVPLCRQLIGALLGRQLADGSWGDPAVTALCLRALLCSQGSGDAVARAVAFFAKLQKPEGLWPKFPVRRMAEDPYVSAFIAYQLGDQSAFRAAVRMDDLIQWFELNEPFLDEKTRALWNHAARRCVGRGRTAALVWS